jgi:hypothetical protein
MQTYFSVFQQEKELDSFLARTRVSQVNSGYTKQKRKYWHFNSFATL